MLLSQLVSAILHDLTTAQDYANEYSSELSKKYKKYEDKDENDLSNYPVPVGRVQEIDFDLKFAIENLETTKKIDIDKTHRNCDRIARTSVNSAIKEFKKVITEELKVTAVSTETAAPESNRLPALDQSQQSEKNTQDSKEKIREWWVSTVQKVNGTKFARYLETKVSQGLYDYVNDQYHESDGSDIDEVKEIIAEELLDGLMEHEDIEILIEQTEKENNWAEGTIRTRLKQMSESVAKNHVKYKELKDLFVMNDENHTKVIVNPSTLKDLQLGMVSSMKIKAELDNYRWMITKTSQSLEKVQE